MKFIFAFKRLTITSLKAENEAKQTYYTALEQSHTEGNREPFYLLVANAVVQSLKKYLSIVEG